ncbi:MAG: hypothetical protein ACXU9U_00450 [Parachlamydiaceae bacterium]
MAKFTLAREHYIHFEKQQFLELEGMLSLQQLQQLKENIKHALTLTKKEYWHTDPKKMFDKGRDLWRKDDQVKKIVLDKHLAAIASDLTGEKLIRLGYDQFLSSECSFEQSDVSLESVSSIQGIVCGAMICLTGCIQEKRSPFFPTKEGNIVFFSPQILVDFSMFSPEQEFLLIVYGGKTSIYIHNEKDSNLHAFKKLGYVFGDRLNDQLNPVLIR